MSNTTKGIIGLFVLFLICFYILKTTHKSSVSSNDSVAEKTDADVFPEVKVNKSEDENFITKGNWTSFKFKDTRWLFDIGLVPEILDRFEKEHPNLCVREGDWQIIYNPINSCPYGILLHHRPTSFY